MQCCQVFELTYVKIFVLLVQYEKSVSELLFFNKPLPIISLSCTLVVLFFFFFPVAASVCGLMTRAILSVRMNC